MVPLTEVPLDIPEERDGDIILAHGEVTGHAHRIKDTQARTFTIDGRRYLITDRPTDVTHEEHATITLPQGRYEVRIQREYTPESIRNVRD
jgi:hypothetical protein